MFFQLREDHAARLAAATSAEHAITAHHVL